MRPWLRNRGGFTLIETVVATAILAGVVIMVVTALNYHVGWAEKIELTRTATLLANEKLGEFSISGLPSETKGDFSPGFPDFRWSCSTEALRYNVKKIYLTVESGKDVRVVLETYGEDR